MNQLRRTSICMETIIPSPENTCKPSDIVDISSVPDLEVAVRSPRQEDIADELRGCIYCDMKGDHRPFMDGVT